MCMIRRLKAWFRFWLWLTNIATFIPVNGVKGLVIGLGLEIFLTPRTRVRTDDASENTNLPLLEFPLQRMSNRKGTDSYPIHTASMNFAPSEGAQVQERFRPTGRGIRFKGSRSGKNKLTHISLMRMPILHLTLESQEDVLTLRIAGRGCSYTRVHPAHRMKRRIEDDRVSLW